MKLSLPKPIAVFLLAAAGAILAAALALTAAPVFSRAGAEADENGLPQGSMVRSVQTNAYGEEVELGILRSEGGTYYLADTERKIYMYNMRNNLSTELKEIFSSDTGVFSDAYAVSAYQNFIRIYDFYADAENLGVAVEGVRREGRSLPVLVLLHYGQSQSNAHYAFENGAVLLEIGDGNSLGPLRHTALAADVLAHEYQHAITDARAQLTYLNDAGAISEAISDIMGALAEGHSPEEPAFWLTGEEAVAEGAEPMRSAILPRGSCCMNALRKYPRCDLDHGHENCDFGGVHSNCTILTHMQYNLWRKMPAYFTAQRIGTLWYATLCSLSSNADFSEFALRFREAAQNLQFDPEALDAIDCALFESGITAENAHLVTFFNSVPDVEVIGYPIEEITVPHGGTATPPVAPGPVYTAEYIYTFLSWRGDPSFVTEDRFIFTNYSARDRYYTVRFLDEAGNLLKEEQLLYGKSATPPVPPFKEGTEAYLYPFLGWDKPYDRVEGDLTLYAVYGKELRPYRATLLSGGKLYRTYLIPYGSVLPLPTISGSRGGNEEFAGWYLDEECTVPAGEIEMTEDVTLYAKWTEIAPEERPAAAVWVPAVVAGGAIAVAAAAFLLIRKRRKKR